MLYIHNRRSQGELHLYHIFIIGVVKGEPKSISYINNRRSQGGGEASSISYIHNRRSQGWGGASSISYIQKCDFDQYSIKPLYEQDTSL